MLDEYLLHRTRKTWCRRRSDKRVSGFTQIKLESSYPLKEPALIQTEGACQLSLEAELGLRFLKNAGLSKFVGCGYLILWGFGGIWIIPPKVTGKMHQSFLFRTQVEIFAYL